MLRRTDTEYQEIVKEAESLEEKVNKLEEFLIKCRRSEVSDITLPEIHTLEEQLHYMRGYLRTLKYRIEIVRS